MPLPGITNPHVPRAALPAAVAYTAKLCLHPSPGLLSCLSVGAIPAAGGAVGATASSPLFLRSPSAASPSGWPR
ncbi:hypothetical protein THICB6_20259 [Thiomonas arsenitoxydans]|nr:hypothetical protein THICB6_20259 [Thiomonas arsenitoxydans]